ncbi:hypothetical protein [Roseobacter weihaiensis]|uniref:hypothetical protein n=1 Tax=Roseobacter weihaiensis TaxID=2763262 RepID=UPI001D0B7100|nr:hypothetical protein [Roseobacter sp. H9]
MQVERLTRYAIRLDGHHIYRMKTRQVLAKVDLPSGLTLRNETGAEGFMIRLQGRGVDAKVLEKAMTCLQEALTKE